MVDVVTFVHIRAPLARVSEFAMNPDNAPLWYENITRAEWKTPKPLNVGTRIAFTAHFLGKELRYTYEIAEKSPERLVMRTSDGPFPMETSYTFEKLDENLTRMTLRNRGMPAGFSKLLSPFMSMMMRKANKKDLRAIKAILEKNA